MPNFFLYIQLYLSMLKIEKMSKLNNILNSNVNSILKRCELPNYVSMIVPTKFETSA